MKLISLNTWGGRVYLPLMDFIRKHAQDTDIFCFQEIYATHSDIKQYKNIRANLLHELAKTLPDFTQFYSKEISGFDSNPEPVDFDLTVGKAIFVGKNINVKSSGDLLIYGNRPERELKTDFSNLPITLQYIDFVVNNNSYTVCNIHGTSFPGSKLDTKIRIAQSIKINEFLKTKQRLKIVTGDFNLLPETQSINILQQNLRNLIKEFNIKRTRSNLSPYFGKEDFQKFADYIFVSKDIMVKNFQVPEVGISDHLPMILEFETL